MVNLYLTAKTLHLLSVISWMAGILYLPRLFVYHSATDLTPSQDQVFQTMERRLYYYIATPAMILSLISGLILLLLPNSPLVNGEHWIFYKLVLIAGMVYYHTLLNQFRLRFLLHENRHTSRFFRILNEVPTVILLLILVLVVFKPRM